MKAKITYARLQERVAAAAGIPKKEAQNLLKEMTAAVGAGLVADGKVTLAGLGRFNRKVQRARRGRNPQTGEPIDIPEKNRVDFLPEARWRHHINREFEHMPAVPEPLPAPPATPKTRPSREAGASHRTNPEKPAQPVEAETIAPVASPPVSPAADAGDITPAKKIDRNHRHKLALTIGVILLVVAALFFLWPRAQGPEPPAAPRPVPTRTAVNESPGPPETSQPEPEGQAAFETATVAAAEATPMEPAPAKPATPSGYTVAAGDSLWKIANTAYDYPYFWPVIFLANHADIQHPDTLTVGMHLAIPAFAGRVGRLVESDFQQLADGYLRVYQVYRQHHHPRAPYYLWVAYRLRSHRVPAHELLMGKPEDRKFISWIKGRGLIH